MKLFYGEINLICIVMLFIVFLNLIITKNYSKVFLSFRFIIINIIILMVFDATIYILEGISGNSINILLKVFSLCYFIMISGTALNILNFVMRKYNFSFKKYISIIISIPALLSILISVVSYFNEIAYNITSDNRFDEGPFYKVIFIICAFYVLCGIGISIFKIYRSTLHEEKRDGYFIIVFLSLIIVGGLFQTIDFEYNIMYPVTCMGLFILYLNLSRKNDNVDYLCDVYNKESYEYIVDNYLSKGLGCFILIDVDNFSLINENYGHKQGDQYLKMISLSLKKLFNKSSIIGRVGGDRFSIFIKKDVDKTNIFNRCNTFLKSVNNFLTRVTTIKFSCSIGISFVNDENKKYPKIFKEADEALHFAKGSGKDKYIVYNEQEFSINYLKKMMLIVEDDELNRVILSSHFSKNFNILEASNGKEALNLILKFKEEIDIILLDLIMPVMSGIDLIKEIRKLDIQDLKIIVISIEDLNKEDIDEIGVDGYISKPFDLFEANEVIKKVKE